MNTIQERYPFYFALVPKGFKENIFFRRRVLARASHDPEFRSLLWTMCARDTLFWINTFCYGYDPRSTRDGCVTRPFITWPAQDEWVDTLERSLHEQKGVVWKKPRDIGGSFLALFADVHEWLFSEVRLSFLWMSRKAELVDGKSMDALFSKIDFMLKWLPGWMLPPYTRTRKPISLLNEATGTTIDGETTTTGFAVGGRRTRCGIDEAGLVPELATIRNNIKDVTDCPLFLSTGYVGSDEFRSIWESGVYRKIDSRWWHKPGNLRGAYVTPKGELRSKVYDKQEQDRPAQAFRVHFLGDFVELGAEYYEPSEMTRLALGCCPPYLRGELEWDKLLCRPRGFVVRGDGKFQLWTMLDRGFRPYPGLYVVGADISAGRGASNTVLTVLNAETGEVVMEWVDPYTPAREAGRMAVAVTRWFHDAFLIWEANGPGLDFGKAVVDECQYSNIFWRMEESKVGARASDFPGYWTSPQTKDMLLGSHRDALKKGRLIDRCAESIEECRSYIYVAGGIEHKKAYTSEDPSGAKANHGDRVISRAMCVRGMDEVIGRPNQDVEPSDNGKRRTFDEYVNGLLLPYDSVGGRRLRMRKAIVRAGSLSVAWSN